MLQTKTRPYARAPLGVVTGQPVLMRLLPHERAVLKQHAEAANSSLSGFARRMTLAGLTQFEGDTPAHCVTCIRPAR